MCVKNIPTKLNIDYKKEITKIFEECGLPTEEGEIKVCKVVLVHDIEEIEELEKELDKTIKAK